ncbi:TonB-linked SusC/RagA family outer membrane protein [Elizabethkingia sp. YR214]|uniref:SusC/RagA family TonB-linked outer membrane protein n=1 Tax=Elizabethkingia sp. YR214 TaxID=2135667 RepID=UPI000D324C35|nr:SusC/RagA family TonB-linked outer membrane protein [Elizabethkingia sp. YR214]PUB29381.1 TonB-linked SusC/RagA family outer membrane protein [Elizabethkingia sp. YR214]
MNVKLRVLSAGALFFIGQGAMAQKQKKDTSSVKEIQEVTVSTGYQKLSKRTFTGAASKISAKELKVEGVPDVSRMIEGKVAGVNVQNITGTFGTAPKITIRGASSIFGDTKPLWVIDGIVQEDIVNVSLQELASGNAATLLSSAVSGLNSSDVESIEVLKDASATSIYGSRAMNGVVVVTTKNGGRRSKMNISYSQEQTIRAVPSYSQYNILNSQETMSILQEMEDKGFLGTPSVMQGRYSGPYGLLAREIFQYDTNTNSFGVKNNLIDRNAFLRRYEMANTDWFKQLFRSSITQNHSLSFSGGGENNAFYASLGMYFDPGWSIADKVSRLTSNIKNTFYISDKFNVTLSTIASVRNQKAPGTYNSTPDVVFGSTTRDFDINPFNYALNTSRALRPYNDAGEKEYYRANWANFNILNELQNNKISLDVKDIRFQVDGNYKILPELTYNFNVSARYVTSKTTHDMYEGSNVAKAYNAAETTLIRDANIFLYKDPNDPTAPKTVVLPNGGIRKRLDNSLESFLVRNTLNYSKIFNARHELDVFLGQEVRYVNRSSEDYTAFGLQYDKGLIPFTDPNILAKMINEGNNYFGMSEERERAVSFFGKLNYTFDRKYTLALTGRYDASNRQGQSTSSRWLPTYTVSGKWNMKNENFLKNNQTISALNLRGSYGLTATSGPATNSLAIYRNSVTLRQFIKDRESALFIDQLQNADLTWEKQYETNIGVDLSLFHNRVQFVADVYQRKAFDLIDWVTTSGIGGQKLKQGNNANMKTKGIEFSLTHVNFSTHKFRWSSTWNASYYKQEITHLENKAMLFDLVGTTGGNVIGRPRNSIFSYHFEGLDNQGLPILVTADGSKNILDINFQDRENPTKYLKYEGSIEPNKTISLTNTFKYDNWSVSFLVVASGGNKIRLTPAFASEYSDITVFTKDYTNRWIRPGDEQYTNVPVIADKRLINQIGGSDIQKLYNAYNYSDERIASGDFVRLKDVSVAYEFPQEVKSRIGLTSFGLKLSAANPWLIYSDKKLRGEDPEFFRSGGVSAPITKQYTLTLNIGF